MVGGKDLLKFFRHVGVDGPAVPSAQHTLAPNLPVVLFR